MHLQCLSSTQQHVLFAFHDMLSSECSMCPLARLLQMLLLGREHLGPLGHLVLLVTCAPRGGGGGMLTFAIFMPLNCTKRRKNRQQLLCSSLADVAHYAEALRPQATLAQCLAGPSGSNFVLRGLDAARPTRSSKMMLLLSNECKCKHRYCRPTLSHETPPYTTRGAYAGIPEPSSLVPHACSSAAS